MGIVNITPDSFYDGGKNNSIKSALLQIEKHLSEGATFIDIGGYSSRPGASSITEKDEIDRIAPIVRQAVAEFSNCIISIDSFRSNVARQAIEDGASIINDISAGQLDSKMFETVIELNVPYIMMHMKGTPDSMQKNPTYENILLEIGYYFSEKINFLKSQGVSDILLDVGFGFGKTMEHNYELLAKLGHFQCFESPILTGISRKSMIYKKLNTTPENALNGTSALHMIALQQGSSILRVHDVKEAVECIELWKQIDNYSKE